MVPATFEVVGLQLISAGSNRQPDLVPLQGNAMALSMPQMSVAGDIRPHSSLQCHLGNSRQAPHMNPLITEASIPLVALILVAR